MIIAINVHAMLCHRHVGLQLEPLCRAVDPVAAMQAEARLSSASRIGSEGAGEPALDLLPAACSSGGSREALAEQRPQQVQEQLVWQAEVVGLLDSLHTELSVAAQLLEAQSGSAEALALASVPAAVTAALEADLQVLDLSFSLGVGLLRGRVGDWSFCRLGKVTVSWSLRCLAHACAASAGHPWC